MAPWLFSVPELPGARHRANKQDASDEGLFLTADCGRKHGKSPAFPKFLLDKEPVSEVAMRATTWTFFRLVATLA